MSIDKITPQNLVELAGGTGRIFSEVEDFKPGTVRWYEMVLVRIRDYGIDGGTIWLADQLKANNEMFLFTNGEEPTNAFLAQDWQEALWNDQVAFWGSHLNGILLKKDEATEEEHANKLASWMTKAFAEVNKFGLLDNLKTSLEDHRLRSVICGKAVEVIVYSFVNEKSTAAKTLSMMGVVAPGAHGWPEAVNANEAGPLVLTEEEEFDRLMQSDSPWPDPAEGPAPTSVQVAQVEYDAPKPKSKALKNKGKVDKAVKTALPLGYITLEPHFLVSLKSGTNFADDVLGAALGMKQKQFANHIKNGKNHSLKQETLDNLVVWLKEREKAIGELAENLQYLTKTFQ